jgi:hypothetical protein
MFPFFFFYFTFFTGALHWKVVSVYINRMGLVKISCSLFRTLAVNFAVIFFAYQHVACRLW